MLSIRTTNFITQQKQTASGSSLSKSKSNEPWVCLPALAAWRFPGSDLVSWYYLSSHYYLLILLTCKTILLLSAKLCFPKVEVKASVGIFFYYYRAGKISWDMVVFFIMPKEPNVSTISWFCPCPILFWAFLSYHGEGKMKSSKKRGQDSFGCTVCFVPSRKGLGRIHWEADSKGIELTDHPVLLHHRGCVSMLLLFCNSTKSQVKHYTLRV